MCYETKGKLMTICWWHVQTYHHPQHQIAVERDPKRMTKAHTPFDGLPGPKLQCVPISMDGTIIIIIYNYLWWWFLPTLQHWISECNHKNHYEPILSHQKPAAQPHHFSNWEISSYLICKPSLFLLGWKYKSFRNLNKDNTYLNVLKSAFQRYTLWDWNIKSLVFLQQTTLKGREY